MADGGGGRPPYYIAARLVLAAIDNWNTFNGWCVARGIRPIKLPEPDLLDLIQFWLTDGLSEQGLADFERQLTMPPALHKVEKNDPIWSADSEMALFKKSLRPKK